MFGKHMRAVLLEVHTWTGLVLGSVLYVMLLFGAVALYREELGRWEDPAQHVVGPAGSDAEALAALDRFVPRSVPRLYVERPHDGVPVHFVWHPVQGRETWRPLVVDAARGAVRSSSVHASRFLFNVHFLWHETTPLLYYVAGLVSVGFLLAIVTGVVFHLKLLFPQLGLYRPGTTPRVAMTDLHKVLGVFGIPFQLVFAVTGAFIVLGPVLVGSYVGPVFGGDRERAERMVWGEPAPIEPTVTVEGDLDDRIAFAERRYPGLEVESFSITDRGTRNEALELEGRRPGRFAGEVSLVFRGLGMPLHAVAEPANEPASAAVTRWVFGLHYARFGGPLLRVFYALLALAAAATVLTGNLIWIARKDAASTRLLRASTEATGAGAVLAAAMILLASRWLPHAMDSRDVALDLTFLATFAAVHVDAWFARSTRTALVRHLALIGIAFLLFPIATASMGSRGLFAIFAGSASSGASVVGVDAFGLVVGVVALVLAAVLRVRPRASDATGVEADDAVPTGDSEPNHA